MTPYFHAQGADRMIDFLKRAFGAEELASFKSPEGIIHHAKLRIGDSIVELGEAHGEFQPMRTRHLHVCGQYRRDVSPGSSGRGHLDMPPTDQPYGDRNAWVDDQFGNSWFIATHLGAPPKG